MEGYIDEVRRNFARRNRPGQLIDAESRAGGGENVIGFGREPRRIPELECIAVSSRQRAHETGDPLPIELPARRELKETPKERISAASRGNREAG
jgi:hypothetical protein